MKEAVAIHFVVGKREMIDYIPSDLSFNPHNSFLEIVLSFPFRFSTN